MPLPELIYVLLFGCLFLLVLCFGVFACLNQIIDSPIILMLVYGIAFFFIVWLTPLFVTKSTMHWLAPLAIASMGVYATMFFATTALINQQTSLRRRVLSYGTFVIISIVGTLLSIFLYHKIQAVGLWLQNPRLWTETCYCILSSSPLLVVFLAGFIAAIRGKYDVKPAKEAKEDLSSYMFGYFMGFMWFGLFSTYFVASGEFSWLLPLMATFIGFYITGLSSTAVLLSRYASFRLRILSYLTSALIFIVGSLLSVHLYHQVQPAGVLLERLWGHYVLSR